MASQVQVAGLPLVQFVVVICVAVVGGVCLCTYPLIKLNRWRLKQLVLSQQMDGGGGEEEEEYDEEEEMQPAMLPPPRQPLPQPKKRMSMFNYRPKGPPPLPMFSRGQGPPGYPPPQAYPGYPPPMMGYAPQGGPPMGYPPQGGPPPGGPPPMMGYPPQGPPPQAFPPQY